MPDEAILLQKASAGDSDSLRALLEQFGPQVWNEVRSNIGAQWQSMVDADDVMQVTYLEAFLQAQQLTARDAAGFLAWLRRIAQNNLRDAIKELERKKRPHPGRRVQAPAGEESYVALVEMLGVTSSTPSRHVAAQETQRLVESVLDALPSDYRTAVRLYDLEGCPIGDVAERMGRSSGAIHMLRARAHDRLRQLLAEGQEVSHDFP
jgi:RNA polymerase sigma-70 factor (ECF subfamily)